MNRTDKPNLHADTMIANTVLTVLTTSKGWIIRQALKWTGSGLATFGAYAASKAIALGLPVDKVEAIIQPGTALASAVVVLVIEGALSYLARKNP